VQDWLRKVEEYGIVKATRFTRVVKRGIGGR